MKLQGDGKVPHFFLSRTRITRHDVMLLFEKYLIRNNNRLT